MEKISNRPGAITELMAAADARPYGDLQITAELVRLLLAVNRPSDARNYLDKLASSPQLSTHARRWLVRMYMEQGQDEKALALVAAETGTAADDLQHGMMLADLTRRVGHANEAAALYIPLLDKPIGDPGFCLTAANFFASRHDMATADRFLARLGECPLKPGELEASRGAFAEQWTGIDEAHKQYQAAVQAAPQNGLFWERLIGFCLRHELYSHAVKAAAQATAALPADSRVKALHDASVQIESLGEQDVQPLVGLLCRDPKDAGGHEMLDAMVASSAEKLAPSEAVQKLRAIADRHPQSLPLKVEVMQTCMSAGMTSEALNYARQVAEVFPSSPEPHRVITRIYIDAGEWTKAEQAAIQWREHASEDPMPADLALADIYMHQPKMNAAGAVRALDPYIWSATATRHPAVLEQYVKALVLAGRSGDAGDILKPLIAGSAHWRAVWLELAGLQRDADGASAWIAQVSDLIPRDAQSERVNLAAAWYQIGDVFDSTDACNRASDIVKPMLVNSTDPQAWMLAGQIAQLGGDFETAEKSYRQALKADPDLLAAANNLAYVMWLEGDEAKVPEARKLAEAAVAAQPGNSVFHDTLGRIIVRVGDTKGAVNQFRLAIQKDPMNIEPMIGLADLLARDPATRGQARDLLVQIQGLLEVNPRLSGALRKQYQAVRESVAASS
jgi:type IV pilus assembly protein PilF